MADEAQTQARDLTRERAAARREVEAAQREGRDVRGVKIERGGSETRVQVTPGQVEVTRKGERTVSAPAQGAQFADQGPVEDIFAEEGEAEAPVPQGAQTPEPAPEPLDEAEPTVEEPEAPIEQPTEQPQPQGDQQIPEQAPETGQEPGPEEAQAEKEEDDAEKTEADKLEEQIEEGAKKAEQQQYVGEAATGAKQPQAGQPGAPGQPQGPQPQEADKAAQRTADQAKGTQLPATGPQAELTGAQKPDTQAPSQQERGQREQLAQDRQGAKAAQPTGAEALEAIGGDQLASAVEEIRVANPFYQVLKVSSETVWGFIETIWGALTLIGTAVASFSFTYMTWYMYTYFIKGGRVPMVSESSTAQGLTGGGKLPAPDPWDIALTIGSWFIIMFALFMFILFWCVLFILYDCGYLQALSSPPWSAAFITWGLVSESYCRDFMASFVGL